MWNNPKISIIVAIYNQEAYLHKALSCIRNNSFDDYEVLLINDGSTDHSKEICLEYCSLDSRFKYYEKINGGVASARQFGIERVKGEYTIHVDPDDKIEPRFLEQLYNVAKSNHSDIVICDYISEYIDHEEVITGFRGKTVEDFKIQLCNGTIWGICWNKLIKTSIFKNKINFEPGIDFQEDKLFIFRVAQNIKSLSYIDEPLYIYNRKNNNSAINNQSKKSLEQSWKVKKLIVDSEQSDDLRDTIKDVVVNESSALETYMNRNISQREYLDLVSPFKDIIWNIGKGRRKIIFRLSLICHSNFSKYLINKIIKVFANL